MSSSAPRSPHRNRTRATRPSHHGRILLTPIAAATAIAIVPAHGLVPAVGGNGCDSSDCDGRQREPDLRRQSTEPYVIVARYTALVARVAWPWARAQSKRYGGFGPSPRRTRAHQVIPRPGQEGRGCLPRHRRRRRTPRLRCSAAQRRSGRRYGTYRRPGTGTSGTGTRRFRQSHGTPEPGQQGIRRLAPTRTYRAKGTYARVRCHGLLSLIKEHAEHSTFSGAPTDNVVSPRRREVARR